MRRLLIMTCGVLVLCGTVWAEPPLAEVAKREAERRQTVKNPTKVITNADLKRGVPLTMAATPATKPASTETPQASAQPSSAASGQPAHDEAWWRKRVSDLHDELNHNRLFADALQSRVNALWADFTARDDPAQRSLLERERNEALAELERVKAEVTKIEQSLIDLDEEARRANVPAGWLR